MNHVSHASRTFYFFRDWLCAGAVVREVCSTMQNYSNICCWNTGLGRLCGSKVVDLADPRPERYPVAAAYQCSADNRRSIVDFNGKQVEEKGRLAISLIGRKTALSGRVINLKTAGFVAGQPHQNLADLIRS